MNLSDKDFLLQFEQKTLPEDEFNHRGHLRLALLYLHDGPLDEAIQKTTKGIKAYATSLGATEKFHHTLTEAVVRIIHGRLRQAGPETLDAFLSGNPDLVHDLRAVLSTYYSEDLLNSEAAKRSFSPPDLRSFL